MFPHFHQMFGAVGKHWRMFQTMQTFRYSKWDIRGKKGTDKKYIVHSHSLFMCTNLYYVLWILYESVIYFHISNIWVYSDAVAAAIWSQVSPPSLSLSLFLRSRLYKAISGIAQAHSMCVIVRMDFSNTISTLLFFPRSQPSIIHNLSVTYFIYLENWIFQSRGYIAWWIRNIIYVGPLI